MFKKIVVSGVVVFILWAVLGFVVNAVILRSAYEATVELWRPMAEMKMRNRLQACRVRPSGTGIATPTSTATATIAVALRGWIPARPSSSENDRCLDSRSRSAFMNPNPPALEPQGRQAGNVTTSSSLAGTDEPLFRITIAAVVASLNTVCA